MKTKKILALLLATGLLLGIAACGKKSEPSAKPGEASAAQGQKLEDVDAGKLEWGKLRPEGLSADYPKKPLTYSYAFGAGSPQDAYIRTLFAIIEKNEGWKNKMVVQYNEGAGGRIGWSSLAAAPKDCYTIGFTPTAMLIPANSEDVKFGLDSFDMLFNMMSDPGVVGVAVNAKYQTLAELLAAAKEKPGTISIGVTSTIGQEGLTVQLLEKASGAKFNMTAFNSEPDVLAGVQGGHIDAFCLNVSDCTTFVENGAVKFLATGDVKRSQFYPNVPTYKEAGFDVTQVNMRAVSAPKGSDPLAELYLQKCLLKAAADPEAQQKAKDLQIPLDTLNAKQVSERFAALNQMYKELWASDPWNK